MSVGKANISFAQSSQIFNCESYTSVTCNTQFSQHSEHTQTEYARHEICNI